MNTNLKRLQKRIAEQSDYSRRKAEELIIEGKVSVNGKTIQELGYKVTDKDKIEIEGVALNTNEKKYFILNKPEKCVSTVSDDKGRKTVIDFIKTKAKVYPIGRLDYDTTGILLLTNDGDFANLLMHPSSNIEKVYSAKIDGIMTLADIKELKQGVLIDGYKTKECRVKVRKVNNKSNTSIIEIGINEGRNHQIKKMFKALGFNVLKLDRIRYGILTIENLKRGESKELSKKDVSRLYVLANNKGNRNGKEEKRFKAI
ncbi:MAG: rRNA pseudouridine synthase [Clostridiales bacterium]|nr:rRNA pseudouridine synthase [Clostridiales bacterium]